MTEIENTKRKRKARRSIFIAPFEIPFNGAGKLFILTKNVYGCNYYLNYVDNRWEGIYQNASYITYSDLINIRKNIKSPYGVKYSYSTLKYKL
jgi:hypothetical protein